MSNLNQNKSFDSLNLLSYMSIYEKNNLTKNNNIFENFINFKPTVLGRKLVKAADKPSQIKNDAKRNEDFNDSTENIFGVTSLNSYSNMIDTFK
jgi:hypothetical protein